MTCPLYHYITAPKLTIDSTEGAAVALTLTTSVTPDSWSIATSADEPENCRKESSLFTTTSRTAGTDAMTLNSTRTAPLVNPNRERRVRGAEEEEEDDDSGDADAEVWSAAACCCLCPPTSDARAAASVSDERKTLASPILPRTPTMPWIPTSTSSIEGGERWKEAPLVSAAASLASSCSSFARPISLLPCAGAPRWTRP